MASFFELRARKHKETKGTAGVLHQLWVPLECAQAHLKSEAFRAYISELLVPLFLGVELGGFVLELQVIAFKLPLL